MTLIFKSNEKGTQRDIYVNREAKRAFLIGPIYTFLILGLSYVSMCKWLIFFYFSGAFLMLLAILLFIFAPIRMLNRHNRTISSVSIEDDLVCFKTFKALWMKSKEIVISKSQLRAKYSIFNCYGKQIKEGIILKDRDEYYLVLEYFTESEKIKMQLM